MKVSTAEQTLLRTYPQRSRVYLGVEQGVTILTAQVDGLHTEGDTTILLKNVTCADTDDLRMGMTVAFHNVITNDRKVSACFISYNSGTLILTIGANAETCTDNEYVTVYSARKLWKVDAPAWDGDQHILPFAIAGPDRAGFINEPLNFVGAQSYHPLGVALSTYAWKDFDATLVSGDEATAGTVSAPIVLSWSAAGEYLVKLKVTDANGETNKTLRTVLMFERTGANAPYQEIVFNTLPKWTGTGWTCNVTVHGVGDRDEFPAQAKVIIWKEDWYGETKGCIGGAFRGVSETLFVGYIREGSTLVSADEKSVTFDLDSTEMLMQHLEMDDFTFRDGLDTTGWTTFSGLTVAKALLHLIQQRTTLDAVCDVFIALLDYDLDILDVPSATFYDQVMQSLLGTCFGFIGGSRFGSVTFGKHRNMMLADERAYMKTAAITFAPQDWLSLRIDEERYASTAQVILEGQDGTGAPILAKYPQSGPGHNGAIARVSGFLFADQTQANLLAHQMYKRDNRQVKRVTLELPNYATLEPAFQECFALYLPEAYNTRGLDWVSTQHGITGKEYHCVEMEFRGGDGYMTVMLAGERSVFADDGDGWDELDPPPTMIHVYGYDQCFGISDTGTV